MHEHNTHACMQRTRALGMHAQTGSRWFISPRRGAGDGVSVGEGERKGCVITCCSARFSAIFLRRRSSADATTSSKWLCEPARLSWWPLDCRPTFLPSDLS